MKLTLKQLKSLIREQVEAEAPQVAQKAAPASRSIKKGPQVFVLSSVDETSDTYHLLGIFMSMEDAKIASDLYKAGEDYDNGYMKVVVRAVRVGKILPMFPSGEIEI